MEWTTAGDDARFGMPVHHTDAERGFVSDRDGPIGVLDQSLDEAGNRGWVVVDMAGDGPRIWPGEQARAPPPHANAANRRRAVPAACISPLQR